MHVTLLTKLSFLFCLVARVNLKQKQFYSNQVIVCTSLIFMPFSFHMAYLLYCIERREIFVIFFGLLSIHKEQRLPTLKRAGNPLLILELN